MEIKQVLKNIDFTDKEASVYMACLQLGKTTATNIARKAGIKRPTTYVILQDLIDKGYVSLMQTQKATLYAPSHPKRILTKLKRKEELADELFPHLLAMYKERPSKPSVEMFEGEAGMIQVYGDVIRFLKKGKEVLIYGNIDHLEDNKDAVNFWLKESADGRHKIRELIHGDSKYAIEYAKLQKQNKNKYYELQTNVSGGVLNDNIIYGDKLVIFSTTDEPFALVIENKQIADSYRAVFDGLWNNI